MPVGIDGGRIVIWDREMGKQKLRSVFCRAGHILLLLGARIGSRICDRQTRATLQHVYRSGKGKIIVPGRVRTTRHFGQLPEILCNISK